MPRNDLFVEKLVKRLDRIDKSVLKRYVNDFAEENQIYRDVLNEIQEGVAICSREGSFIYLNPQASDWLGLQGDPREKKYRIRNIADSELNEYLRAHIPSTTQRMVEDIHVLIPFDLYLRVTVLPMAHWGQDLFLIILENHTYEISQYIDSSKIARIEALVRLAAGVAHEIGNPLNSLSIHLQLLNQKIQGLKESEKKDLGQSLSVIQDETERLDRTVRNFLQATRKPPLRFRFANLHKILERALDFMQPELEKNQIKVKLRSDKKIPNFLFDEDRIYQALINLIKNSMEAMPDGGTLSVTLSQKEKLTLLRFKDDGVGIHKDDLPHIFDAYFTTKPEGSGLGLMTVYNAVNEHGGRIDVDSQPGKGSVFTVMIPINKPKLQLAQMD